MRIGFFINTPAQVHFFRGVIKDLRKRNNEVLALVRDHPDTLKLIEHIDIEYSINSGLEDTKFGRIHTFPKLVLRANKELRDFNPDLIFGVGPYAILNSLLLDIPVIVFRNSFRDDFQYNLKRKLFDPISDTIVSPITSPKLDSKHIKINSFIEMNYLSPSYFNPDPAIRDTLGISEGEDYCLVRFNSFEALHDVEKRGFDRDKKIELVKKLKKQLKVFVSSESSLPKEIKRNRLETPMHKIHDVLYYSKLFISDTQTMTTESAILGTPVVRSNSFVGENDMGNFIELEDKYGLIYNIRNAGKAINKASELVKREKLDEEWKKKREKLIEDKIDMRKFMVWFLENYPKSFEKMKRNPEIQYRFK